MDADNGQCSIKWAAENYKVPRSTLRDCQKIEERAIYGSKSGPSSYLKGEESQPPQFVVEVSEISYRKTRKQIKS